MSDDDLKLPSGREFYANLGIVGIDAYGSVTEGYDGGIDVWGDWSKTERQELAELMIERWKKFAEMDGPNR